MTGNRVRNKGAVKLGCEVGLVGECTGNSNEQTSFTWLNECVVRAYGFISVLKTSHCNVSKLYLIRIAFDTFATFPLIVAPNISEKWNLYFKIL